MKSNLRPVWIIAKKELGSFFDSLIAYILLIAFLGFSGFFTWLFGADVFLRKQADLLVFFGVAQWSLFFFIPALTMRQLAEERKTGTIELLLTKAISHRQLVVGKWLACFLLVCITLAFTLPYYFTISKLGNVDHGATISGYLALLLLSSAYISTGLFASSITNNQIVAFLLALVIGIFFQFLFGLIASGSTGLVGEIFDYLSLTTHFDSISRGVLDTKDLVFFISLTILGILAAELNLRKSR